MSNLKKKATKAMTKLVRKHGQEVAASIAMSIISAAATHLAEKVLEGKARKDRDAAARKKAQGKKPGKATKRRATAAGATA